jgi:hypothetical protein
MAAEQEEKECFVCVLPIESPLPCGHFVHTECIIRSGKAQCPFCKKKIYLSKQQKSKTRYFLKKYEMVSNIEQSLEDGNMAANLNQQYIAGGITIQVGNNFAGIIQINYNFEENHDEEDYKCFCGNYNKYEDYDVCWSCLNEMQEAELNQVIASSLQQ